MTTRVFRPSSREVRTEPALLARWIRRLAIPIMLGWLAIIVLINILVPSLQQVAADNSVSMNPAGAPSLQAIKEMGRVFGESRSDSVALILLEGRQPLGADAHEYYDDLVTRLRADTAHVQNVQDFWGDPLTEGSAQSPDGKAAYLQLYLSGNIGDTLANESVGAVWAAVDARPPPPGVKVYVTGPAALQADLIHSAERTVRTIKIATFTVIIVLMLFFFRSVPTVLVLLGMVGIQLSAATGVAAVIGYLGVVELSTFAVNLVVAMAIATGTDYAIFLIGRYQEARAAGVDRESAYYEMWHGTAHVVLASGLTIAGAALCMSLTRMPYLQSLGVPTAVAMLVALSVALTLGPAAVTVASRFGLLEPKRAIRIRFWRRIGTAVVRWPAPILLASLAAALVGLIALPFYQPSYNDRRYIPGDIEANAGYAAAEQHFSAARMNPEVLLVEADHDLRNPADFLVIDKLAKAIFRVPGVARVQAITRPDGAPIQHTSIPFMMSMQGVGLQQNMKLMFDRIDDMKAQAESLGNTVAIMKRMQASMSRMAGVGDGLVVDMDDMQTAVRDARDSLADFEDFFRPIRNYFHWEPHCFDIPVCWALRSVSDSVDGIDAMTDQMDRMIKGMTDLNALIPEMIAQFPPMIATMESMQQMMLTMHSTMSGMYRQMDELSHGAAEMGKAFDAARNDDSFYLPSEVFDNPDFRRAMDLFISPDGKSLRMIISHRGDPASAEGISRVDPINLAAIEALKGTPLENAKVSLGGTASVYHDLSEGTRYDLVIAVIATVCLIFAIMLLITRSLVAAMVIVGTVLLSLGASVGLSVLLWQYIVGLPLQWMVMSMAVIILLAVGADYNLMMVARFKEEIPAGLKTGIIRAMGGAGSVVTAAGLVFAFTMTSMVVSDLRTIGQIGTFIGLGLLFDTLIVRSFMVPSIAALLGRWFWWPINVRTRPARARPVRPQA
ncbi:MMPL/RND family transporter [Mycobacterium marinum]|uniref:MMPL/RND family transporter n=1 Tax=Mycobacterium marinum TaxID=1781 RepID=UPI000B972DCD|nr:RND family transporter [Mycobacterium marinum]